MEQVTIGKGGLAEAINLALIAWQRKHGCGASAIYVEPKMVEEAQRLTRLTVFGHSWMVGKVGASNE